MFFSCKWIRKKSAFINIIESIVLYYLSTYSNVSNQKWLNNVPLSSFNFGSFFSFICKSTNEIRYVTLFNFLSIFRSRASSLFFFHRRTKELIIMYWHFFLALALSFFFLSFVRWWTDARRTYQEPFSIIKKYWQCRYIIESVFRWRNNRFRYNTFDL